MGLDAARSTSMIEGARGLVCPGAVFFGKDIAADLVAGGEVGELENNAVNGWLV